MKVKALVPISRSFPGCHIYQRLDLVIDREKGSNWIKLFASSGITAESEVVAEQEKMFDLKQKEWIKIYSLLSRYE